ncbi:MAG: glycoside hydrolase family 127 protein [Candidatus Nanopelagicales bacterium]
MTGTFEYLPPGDVRPAGWLRRQLEAQARGITGRIEQVWPDVGPSSGWLGGPGECWERGPYYVDGLVMLGEVLDDDHLRSLASKWIEWALASQDDQGFFGPGQNRDWWPRMVMLNVLIAHHSATGDERVPPFVEKYLRFALAELPRQPLEMWAAARGAEMLPAVAWYQERADAPWLSELADLLISQSVDWEALYRDFPYPRPVAGTAMGRLLRLYLPPRIMIEDWVRRWKPAKRTRSRTARQIEKANASPPLRFYHRTHGVNHAMALRGVAYVAAVQGDDPDRAARLADDTVMCHHGSAVGVVVADEHLAGRSPIHGIETCTVVETMRSCEELVRITGHGHWGDRLEEVAFNALPAALTTDLMGHQYYQQVNQVEVTRRRRPWFNGGRDGSLFGLEPTYGCCTANQHQGWPRLAASAVMRSVPDDGLAVVALAPCDVATRVAGARVTLSVDTDHPFHGRVRVVVGASDRAVSFPLRLRIPEWAGVPGLLVDGEPVTPRIERGFAVLERVWSDGDEVVLDLPMGLRAESAPVTGKGEPGTVIRRGPLVLALGRREDWRADDPREPVPDWEVRSSDPWAYGLASDAVASARVETGDVPAHPFDHTSPAVAVHLSAARLPEWRTTRGSAGPVPSPLIGAASDEIRLVPYGATALRTTVFPRYVRTTREPAPRR